MYLVRTHCQPLLEEVDQPEKIVQWIGISHPFPSLIHDACRLEPHIDPVGRNGLDAIDKGRDEMLLLLCRETEILVFVHHIPQLVGSKPDRLQILETIFISLSVKPGIDRSQGCLPHPHLGISFHFGRNAVKQQDCHRDIRVPFLELADRTGNVKLHLLTVFRYLLSTRVSYMGTFHLHLHPEGLPSSLVVHHGYRTGHLQ